MSKTQRLESVKLAGRVVVATEDDRVDVGGRAFGRRIDGCAVGQLGRAQVTKSVCIAVNRCFAIADPQQRSPLWRALLCPALPCSASSCTLLSRCGMAGHDR